MISFTTCACGRPLFRLPATAKRWSWRPPPAVPQHATATAETTAAGTTTDAPTPGDAEDAHRDHNEDIVVTGIRRKANDVLGGISVLDEADLTREMRPSIGETLARQPGVSATSFGPTASAPVLRGLSGDRVRVLSDGIGSLDSRRPGPTTRSRSIH